MVKVTFLGAGSTIFAKNVLGDILLTPEISDCSIALYDIDGVRIQDSKNVIGAINEKYNGSKARIKTYLGLDNLEAALDGADFVVNAVQVGGYDPSTIIDFEVPKKYGLRQTIGDTLGIGGIFRGLRTIPIMQIFADAMHKKCPNAWLLNYTNPMSILTGYMQSHTDINTIGLCHSVQVCSENLLKSLDMVPEKGFTDLIAGINHMAWLLQIRDLEGRDLYPEIRKRAAHKNETEKHDDMVRFEYIKRLGYYCTESSEHNAEYNPWFIKPSHPELIDRYNIPLDDYPGRCVRQIETWNEQRKEILKGEGVIHERSHEYASRIIEAMVYNTPYKIGGNVLNRGLITNLPGEACVEVPCLVDGMGIRPTIIGDLPIQLAALNQININVQLLTLKAAETRDREDIYRAVMLEPRCAAQLSFEEMVSMCDELIEAHAASGFPVL